MLLYTRSFPSLSMKFPSTGPTAEQRGAQYDSLIEQALQQGGFEEAIKTLSDEDLDGLTKNLDARLTTLNKHLPGKMMRGFHRALLATTGGLIDRGKSLEAKTSERNTVGELWRNTMKERLNRITAGIEVLDQGLSEYRVLLDECGRGID